ncbi:putative inorganic phosphate cotransporter isoform X2 [Euwallacea fornicatus]|uniref:putative inorganic phosphate cotransporter isoform X2 n=1 Tax=Euwallacea fornicatus TaxID=995702 RepID=UPI00338E794E
MDGGIGEVKGPEVSCIRVRYVQTALLFYLMGTSYAIRSILSVAVVAMVDTNSTNTNNIPTFEWKSTGVLLSSFYWSYAVLQFFAGPIAHMFSPKLILIIAMLVNSGTCLLLPTLSIHLGLGGAILCRLFQGFSQGFIIPLIHTLLGRWAPTNERSWISTTVYSGCSFGTIISMQITGYLSSSRFGWPASFYLFGGLGVGWCVLWLQWGADRPATHRSISAKERRYIEESLGQEHDENLKGIRVPWRAILTSLPYWAIIVAAIGESWGSTFLITEIPTYLSKITDIDIEKNGLYSSAPYVVAAFFTVLYGPIADYMISKGVTSRKTARRLFHGIGAFIPAGALIWLGYEESPWGIAALLIVAISLNGAMFCGYNVNHIDISPRFSGTLFGISNGVGQSLATLAPMLVEFITEEADKAVWRTMFIIAAIIYAGTAAFFITFLSVERQLWDSVICPGKNCLRGKEEGEML